MTRHRHTQTDIFFRKLRERREELQENQRIYGIGGAPVRALWGVRDSEVANRNKSNQWRESADFRPPKASLAAIAPRAEPPASFSSNEQPRLPVLPALSTAAESPSVLALQPDASSIRTNDLESQLAQERRVRTKLELEVQAGKNALASMSAKIEQLSSAVSACQLSFRDAAHLAGDADRRARDVERALDAKLGATAASVKQMIADVAGRHQRQDGQTREDETERYHYVMEQVAGLKYRIESLQMHTAETGESLRIKTQDLHHESRIGVDAMRIAKAHDSAIGGLHATVEAHIATLERRLEAGLRTVAAKTDVEARAREKVTEAHWSKICALAAQHDRQEYEIADRIDALRGTLTLVADQDREESKRAAQLNAEQVRDAERGMAGSMDKLGERISSLEGKITAEATARAAMHEEITADMSHAVADAEGRFRKLLDTIRQQDVDARQAQNATISNLTLAVRQSEAKVLGRVDSLEQVLHAEVSQRSEIGAALQKNLIELHEHIGNRDKVLMDQRERDRSEISENIEAVRASVRKSCDNGCVATKRALHDQETQLVALRTRFHTLESALVDDVQTLRKSLDSTTEKLENDHKTLSNRVDEQTKHMRADLEQAKAAAGTECAALGAEVREKIHVKSLMLDQTLRAFRTDLATRIDKEEFDLTIEKLRMEDQATRDEIAKRPGPAAVDKPSPPKLPEEQPTLHGEFTKVTRILSAQIDALSSAVAKSTIEQKELNETNAHAVAELIDGLFKLQQRQVEILAHISGLQMMAQDSATHEHVIDVQAALNANIAFAVAQLRETFKERIDDTHKTLVDIQMQQDIASRADVRNRTALQTSLTKLVREQEARCREAAAASTAAREALGHDLAMQVREVRVGTETTLAHLATRVVDSSQLCKDRAQETRDGMNRIKQELAMVAGQRGYVEEAARQLRGDDGAMRHVAATAYEQDAGHERAQVKRDEPKAKEPAPRSPATQEPAPLARATSPDHAALPSHVVPPLQAALASPAVPPPHPSAALQVSPSHPISPAPTILQQAPVLQPHQILVTGVIPPEHAGHVKAAIIALPPGPSIPPEVTPATHAASPPAAVAPPARAPVAPVSNATRVAGPEPKPSAAATASPTPAGGAGQHGADTDVRAAATLAPSTFFKPAHLVAPPSAVASESSPDAATANHPLPAAAPIESHPHEGGKSAAHIEKTVESKPPPVGNSAPGASAHNEDLERLADAAMSKLGRQHIPDSKS